MRSARLRGLSSFRARRMARFVEVMGLRGAGDASLRIADLGGSLEFWSHYADLLPPSVAEVVIFNIDQSPARRGRFTVRHGDARELADVADNAFDVAFSNSVIEHVGGPSDVSRFAAEVRRIAPRYFVQTPNYWFAWEPHYNRPFYQLLPRTLTARLLMTHGHAAYGRPGSLAEALDIVDSNGLLTARQLRDLFPEARIERERFGGMTKSLLAIRA